MASARDCARLLLDTMPILGRKLGGMMRQRGSDAEPLTMDQVRLLRILSYEPHTLGELAARHGVTPSTMSRSVDLLVRKAWVSRESDPSDRRQVILRLTDAGHASHMRMVKHGEDMLTRLIDELPSAEQDRLFEGMRILHALLAPHTDENICSPASQTGGWTPTSSSL